MNQNEFMQLVNPFKDKLYRLAKRLLISTDEANDAVQEIMEKLWKKKEQLTEYKSLEALAITMTKNYCLDQLKSKRANNLSIVHSNFTDREAGIFQQTEDKDTWNWVEKIMNALPEQQKLIVQLRDIEEMEFSEIGTVLDMNEQAIRTTLSRARKTIREKMIKTHRYGIG